MLTVFKYHKPHSIQFHTPCYEAKNLVPAMLTITRTANTQRTDRFDVHFLPLFSQHYLYTSTRIWIHITHLYCHKCVCIKLCYLLLTAYTA